MILPITFRNVIYRVAGSSKYKGDLILTPEVVYYFPHTDVANKRFLVAAIILLAVLSPFLVVSASYILYGLAVVLIVLAFTFSGFFQGLAVDMVSNVIKGALESNKERAHHAREQNDVLQQPESVALTLPINLYPIILYPTLWYSVILDSALLTLKENKSLSRHSLPTPIRFSKSDIHHISLSFTGLLTIKAEYDMESKFNLGILRKDMLKKGLIEGGFIS